MISISRLLEFEQLATDSLQDDPETCHRLRNVLARCFTYDWEILTESIKMVVELIRNMKPLLAPRYPLLLRSFKDILPRPFTVSLANPFYIPGLPEAQVLQRFVQGRFQNEPWKYQCFMRDFESAQNTNVPEDNQWEAVTRIFTLLTEAPDLLELFCTFMA